jgi:hypothetical protein
MYSSCKIINAPKLSYDSTLHPCVPAAAAAAACNAPTMGKYGSISTVDVLRRHVLPSHCLRDLARSRRTAETFTTGRNRVRHETDYVFVHRIKRSGAHRVTGDQRLIGHTRRTTWPNYKSHNNCNYERYLRRSNRGRCYTPAKEERAGASLTSVDLMSVLARVIVDQSGVLVLAWTKSRVDNFAGAMYWCGASLRRSTGPGVAALVAIKSGDPEIPGSRWIFQSRIPGFPSSNPGSFGNENIQILLPIVMNLE